MQEEPTPEDDLWAWDRARVLEGDRPPRVVLLGKEFGDLLDLSYALRDAGLDARVVLARTGPAPLFESLLAPAPDLLVILDHDTLYAEGRLGSFLDDERVRALGIPVILGNDLEIPPGCAIPVRFVARPVSLGAFIGAASSLLGVQLRPTDPLPRKSPARAEVAPFTLPGGGALEAAERRAQLRAGRRPRVLFIDEDERFVTSLRGELDELGVEVWHSTTPLGLAAMPRSVPPDALVISREAWPQGVSALVGEWQRRPRFRALEPVILASSSVVDERAFRREVRSLPVHGFLEKPFSVPDLYAQLRPLFDDSAAVPWKVRQALAQRMRPKEPIPPKAPAALAAIPEDHLRPIGRALDRATGWVAGHTERVVHGVETRCLLSVHGEEWPGRLQLHWVTGLIDGVGSYVVEGWRVDRFDRVELEAALPPGAALRLTPQEGLRGLVERFVELELGHPRLDDAYIVRGDPAAGPVAVAVHHHLLALRRFRVKIGIGEEALVARAEPFTGGASDLEELVYSLLHLWRELALVRAGIDPGDLGLF